MTNLLRIWSRRCLAASGLLFLAVLPGCLALRVTVTAEDACCGGHGGDGDTDTEETSDIPEDSTTVSWTMNDNGKWYPTVRATATRLKVAEGMEGTDLTHRWAVYGDVSEASSICGTSWFPDPTYLLVGDEETAPAKTEWVLDIELDFLEMEAGEWVSLDILLVANIGSSGGSHNARLLHVCDQAPPGLPMSERP